MTADFAETCVTTNFSFLEGASHPEEFVQQASLLGYRGLGLTDRQSFSGIVRGYFEAKEQHNLRYLVGTRLFLLNADHSASLEVLAYPQTKQSYGALCKLLTIGNLRAEKGSSFIYLQDLEELSSDTFFTILYPRGAAYEVSRPDTAKEVFLQLFEDCINRIKDPTKLSLALSLTYTTQDRSRAAQIVTLGHRHNIPLVATNDALYHCPKRRALQDVLLCIKQGITLQEAGFSLHHNAERYLKPVSEMVRLFSQYPNSISRTIEILEACTFSLKELTYTYPKEIIPTECLVTSSEYFEALTFDEAKKRYPDGFPQKVKTLLHEELILIKELQYEHYFLTCYDIVKFARGKDILCQGRGAAANSAVCYCLGITSVDPAVNDLLFARFVSKERCEPPDIDIDFEHERREEVMQYLYEKYGRNRTALVANVITYRDRSAVRDVGKALGLSLQTVDCLAKLIHTWNHCQISAEDLIANGLDPNNAAIQICLFLTDELIGFPRHLSQHSGGFVICDSPLDEIVPILHSAMESRTIMEWNKDDIELMGMLKIDILALGMLTAIRKALGTISTDIPMYQTGPPLALHTIPQEDPKTYDMICKADTIGVFQIESRAQMSMLPRLRPRTFYDLVIEVAIVRPGPIQGNMVHPYLRRRMSKEAVEYPNEKIREVLEKTLGVPLFQEQAMRLAIVAADFSPGEAEKLRRAMAAWKRNKAAIAAFTERIVVGMKKNKYSDAFINSCLEQMKGFSEYGFPESHAVSFALLVYASSWIKCHYPAHFTAALLNSQPMGFYSPSQLIRDAKEHGVTVLPISVSHSEWDCTILDTHTIRMGLRYVKGLPESAGKAVRYTADLLQIQSGISQLYSGASLLGLSLTRSSLAAIARADGFSSFNLSVREALWEIRSLPIHCGSLDRLLSSASTAQLKKHSIQQEMYLDYAHTGFSLKAHPIEFIRSSLDTNSVVLTKNLKTIKPKSIIKVAGLLICRQRPGTARGTVFLTLEDETGNANLIVWPKVYGEFRRIVTCSTAVLAQGTVERSGDVLHIIVDHLESLDSKLGAFKKETLPNRTHSY